MPKLDMAQTNSIADKNTTMISMVRLAIMVLMARRDLRFRLILPCAHFTMLIFFSSRPSTAIGFDGPGFSKTGKFRPGISTLDQSPSPDYGEGELIVSRGDDDDCVGIAWLERERRARSCATTLGPDIDRSGD